MFQVASHGWIGADALQYLCRVSELDKLFWGVWLWHSVESLDLLLGIVWNHEETIVTLHLNDVGSGEPIHPTLLMLLLTFLHRLAQSHSLGVDASVVEWLVYRTLDALYEPW